MTHLGDRVASLIDGQLPVDVSGRAMTHLAACPACQQAADLERLTKQRLASLSTPEPGADLVRRLLEMGVPGGPVAPRPGHVPGTARPAQLAPMIRADPSTRPPGRRTVVVQSRPPGAPSGPARRLSRSTRGRLVFAAAGAACLVGVGVAGGVAASQSTARTAVPTVDSFVIQQGPASGRLPLETQAARLSLATARR
jgi:hypothetical protein